MRKAGLLLLALLVLGSCADDDAVGSVVGRIVADPATVDFGGVVVGSLAEEKVQLHNGGRGQVRLEARDLPAGVSVVPASLRIPAAGVATVQIRFRPQEAGPLDAPAIFSLHGADRKEFSIHLTGLGIGRDLAVEGLDFGEVVVGETRTLPLEIESLSDGHLTIELEAVGVEAEVFDLAHTTVELPPREKTQVEVSFRPDIRGPRSAQLVYAPCKGCEPAAVELRGVGALRRVDAAPSVLDFGQVNAGNRVEKTVLLVNNGDIAVSLESVEIRGGDADEFSTTDAIVPATLEPLDTLELPVAFAPPAGASSEGRTAEVVVRGDEGALELVVGLQGVPGGPHLVVSPAFVDFGLQPVGWETRRRFEISNLGEEGPVLVLAMEVEGADGTTFRAEPEQSLPVDVGFAPLAVEAIFEPGSAEHHAAVLVVVTNDDEQPELRIPLSGQGVASGTCDLVALPPRLRFGLVLQGGTYERAVELRQGGTETCVIWDVGLEEGGSELFADAGLPEGPTLLAPGEHVRLPIRFSTEDAPVRRYEATLRVRHTDASTDPLLIPVSGLPGELDLVATPNPVEMGSWPLGFRNFRPVKLGNRSDVDVTIHTAGFADFVSPAFGGGLVDATPSSLPIGSSQPMLFSFAPQAPARDFAQYEIYVNNLPEPFLVDIRGEGNAEDCGELCEAPTAFCPDSVTTRVLDEVRLVGAGAAPPFNVINCRWAVVDGPQGSKAAPDRSVGCDIQFAPDLVGTYDLELTVQDVATGAEGTCITQVMAEPVGGLWVEMVWTPARDMDLHLLHPNAGDPLVYESWTDPLWACFYDTCSPARPGLSWGEATEDDDPSLDRDDISGSGPENARIQVPSDEHPYRLGFRNFSNPNVPVSVTFNVYCGGGLVHGQTWQSTEVQEIVYVGDVTYSEAGCTFDTVGAVLSPPEDP